MKKIWPMFAKNPRQSCSQPGPAGGRYGQCGRAGAPVPQPPESGRGGRDGGRHEIDLGDAAQDFDD
ncbi:hypothetical protein ACIG5E_00660 [Kitasatospora sp. NPDC053057]|uniref:hypothetical protein n=1 Tax=Kitasatospora sp. NPDC053057 TaxID=3364062 RepID=UPI0037C7B39F